MNAVLMFQTLGLPFSGVSFPENGIWWPFLGGGISELFAAAMEDSEFVLKRVFLVGTQPLKAA